MFELKILSEGRRILSTTRRNPRVANHVHHVNVCRHSDPINRRGILLLSTRGGDHAVASGCSSATGDQESTWPSRILNRYRSLCRRG
jgi:hypothetical protein